MIDTWTSIIKSIEPHYDDLKVFGDHSPRIKPTLTRKRSRWVIRLDEVWDNDIRYPLITDELEKRVTWTDSKLNNWKNVNRTAWAIWEFFSKRDAERFLILYGLTWEK